MLVPFKFGRSSQATIRQAASSMSANVLKGENIKNEAMAENYVPFIGSSELSRMDAFHPSVLAQKYHRNYRPFLMGMAGTQDLTHFVDQCVTTCEWEKGSHGVVTAMVRSWRGSARRSLITSFRLHK